MNNSPLRRSRSLVAATLVMGLVIACVDLSIQPSASPQGTAGPGTASPASPGAAGTAAPSASNPTASGCCPVTPPPSATGTGGASSPSASDGPPPTTGPPATPGATIDPALAAQIEAVIAQVPAIRELDELQDVPYEFITRAQFRDDLIELAFEEIPPERLAAEERLLKRMGLLPADADLRQLLLDLYGGQVAAFYRPDTKRFYIIQRDAPFGVLDRIIVAHEYTHALQDQHFDLEGTRITDLAEGDAALGQLAAVEGDATLTMQLWAQNSLTPEELLEFLFGGLGGLNDPTLANMPWILRRQLEFPYTDGFLFIQAVHQSGGYAAVDETLTDAPESTEQILHSEKYFSDEQPVDESIDIPAPEGFDNVYEQTIGELLMQVWVAGDEAPTAVIPGFPVEWPHADAVAGWGGDRVAMYEHDDGRWVIVWETAWDSDADMQEFNSRANEILFGLDAFSRGFPGETGSQYVVVIASDQETLDALAAL